MFEIAKLILGQIVISEKPPNIIATKYSRFTVTCHYLASTVTNGNLHLLHFMTSSLVLPRKLGQHDNSRFVQLAAIFPSCDLTSTGDMRN